MYHPLLLLLLLPLLSPSLSSQPLIDILNDLLETILIKSSYLPFDQEVVLSPVKCQLFLLKSNFSEFEVEFDIRGRFSMVISEKPIGPDICDALMMKRCDRSAKFCHRKS